MTDPMTAPEELLPVALLHEHESGDVDVMLYRNGSGCLTDADKQMGWTETPLYTRPERTAGVGELEAALRGFIMDLTGSLQNRNTMLTINHDALVARIEQGKAALTALRAPDHGWRGVLTGDQTKMIHFAARFLEMQAAEGVGIEITTKAGNTHNLFADDLVTGLADAFGLELADTRYPFVAAVREALPLPPKEPGHE